ncbi:MAG: DUF433 domain-containing protein [Ignavibacteria bacterium]|jgi:uncharacterized protein (DUF433 family)|nr:DUF433 domain-containing protein [Ignavibacteria bacterium]
MQFYQKYIEIDSSVRFGKPVILGTRISVADILEMLANGMSFKEIIVDFPQINETQILACLKYASDKERKLAVAV